MLATRAFHVSQEGHLWCSTVVSTCGGIHARSCLADFHPTPKAGFCRSTFSAHSEKNVTMVITKTTFHHHLWWTKMTTNANHCWHSSTPLVPITVLLILSMAGNSFVLAPLINSPSLRWILIPPNPTDDRAHCSLDEARPRSVTVVKVGHSTPVLSTNGSTGAFESATSVLRAGGLVWAQARFSPGLRLDDQMTSQKHSTVDLDDQLQTNAPPHCPSAHLQH